MTKYREILWLYSGNQYQLTGYGKKCSDISLNTIVDEGECKSALEDLGLVLLGYENRLNYPSGCYLYYGLYGYFNRHESGCIPICATDAKSVCKPGIYQFTHIQSLSKNLLS